MDNVKPASKLDSRYEYQQIALFSDKMSLNLMFLQIRGLHPQLRGALLGHQHHGDAQAGPEGGATDPSARQTGKLIEKSAC